MRRPDLGVEYRDMNSVSRSFWTATFSVIALNACASRIASVTPPMAPGVTGRVANDAPPALLVGAFLDDYGGTHRIDSSAWHHGTHSTYEIVAWHADSQYVIARNATKNRSDGGLWTRIDWVPLDGMPPYTWAFCLSAYKAATRAEAEATRVAKRETPRTGCNGYPFSRMRREG
jgi:hypothetical protein